MSRFVLVEPLALFGWTLVAATVWALRAKLRGRRALAAFTAAYFWFTAPLGANLMLGAFEHAAVVTRACTVPDDAWIVVLAGGIEREPARPGDWEQLQGASLKRTLHGVRLALEQRARPLLLSGGAGDGAHEADLMRDLAVTMGVEPARIHVERDSSNTYENAAGVARLLQRAGAPADVLLVTSALHMVRAVAAFEGQGLRPCPRPLDFRWVPTTDHHAFIPQVSAVTKSTGAIREAAGLLYYRLSGRLAP